MLTTKEICENNAATHKVEKRIQYNTDKVEDHPLFKYIQEHGSDGASDFLNVYRPPLEPSEVCPDCRNQRRCPCCGRFWSPHFHPYPRPMWYVDPNLPSYEVLC